VTELAPYALGDLDAPGARLPTPRQTRFLDWLVDILISIVVINLFVEYAPAVIVESFTMSILTAILLKVVLDAIVRVKTGVLGCFHARGGAWRIAGYGALWLILFVSKFVVLEIVYFAFRDQVELGGFVQVSVLILILIGAREGVALIYHRILGAPVNAPAVRRSDAQ
jgi:hypothetical protein